jgi:hypothetical protein
MIKDLNDKTTISPGEENLLEEAVEEQKEVQKKISTNRRAMQSFAIREEVEPFRIISWQIYPISISINFRKAIIRYRR